MNLIIITGSSGSGKTEVIKYLEDKSFYCVDNLPLSLIETFLNLLAQTEYKNIAIGVDLRGQSLFTENLNHILNIKQYYPTISIIYLDASNSILYKRFNETRRKHPLNYPNLMDAIIKEKEILEPVKNIADNIIDTSFLKPGDLKKEIESIFINTIPKSDISINIYSFGFKYGDFSGAHLLFDVRFLPNPFFIEELKLKTGLESDVYSFVIEKQETKDFLNHLTNLLDYTIPLYKQERRYYLNIAIGCTGGQHRSVAIAVYVYNYLKNKNYNCQIKHRELQKGEL